MRDRMNVYFPPELLKEIADLAARKGLSRSPSWRRRSPPFCRRMARTVAKPLSPAVSTGCRGKSSGSNAMSASATETLALFIRFWLTITPPLPNDAHAAAQVKGRERYEGFIEALGRRLQKGQSLLRGDPGRYRGKDVTRQRRRLAKGKLKQGVAACRSLVLQRRRPTTQ